MGDTRQKGTPRNEQHTDGTAASPCHTVIFDRDGTLYLDADLSAGARDTPDVLRGAGHQVLFASNNTVLTPAAYVRTLDALGIAVSPHGVVTASGRTIAYLQPPARCARSSCSVR